MDFPCFKFKREELLYVPTNSRPEKNEESDKRKKLRAYWATGGSTLGKNHELKTIRLKELFWLILKQGRLFVLLINSTFCTWKLGIVRLKDRNSWKGPKPRSWSDIRNSKIGRAPTTYSCDPNNRGRVFSKNGIFWGQIWILKAK